MHKKLTFYYILTVYFILAFSECQAKPSQIILMRHGEKPEEGPELSLKGSERAAALAPFFLGTESLLKFGAPAAIYATKSGKHENQHTELTVTPLAEALHLKIKTPFTSKEYEQAAREILDNPAFEGKMVLICWEHHVIPEFTHVLGIKEDLPKWHGDVFDQLWIITYLPNGELRFDIKEQALMFGDAPPR